MNNTELRVQRTTDHLYNTRNLTYAHTLLVSRLINVAQVIAINSKQCNARARVLQSAWIVRATECVKSQLLCNNYVKKITRNDPSAGSPTDALLRLLFPLDHTVRFNFHRVSK